MKWKPIGDQVLLKEIKKQEKTASGIIMTAGMDDYLECEVVAVGNGLYTQTGDKIPMTVCVGNAVKIYSGNAGNQKKVQLDTTEYLLVREHEIALINTEA